MRSLRKAATGWRCSQASSLSPQSTSVSVACEDHISQLSIYLYNCLFSRCFLFKAVHIFEKAGSALEQLGAKVLAHWPDGEITLPTIEWKPTAF